MIRFAASGKRDLFVVVVVVVVEICCLHFGSKGGTHYRRASQLIARAAIHRSENYCALPLWMMTPIPIRAREADDAQIKHALPS